MELTLAQLAELLNVELRGHGGITVSEVATLKHAGPGALSFLSNTKYRKYL